MKFKIALLTLAVTLVGAGSALAMTKEEHKTQKDRIHADYKTSQEKCSALKGNVKDICHAEAKGVEKVAKAELEAQYKPSARNERKTKEAKAEAAYDVAKEKCDELEGDAKKTCTTEARTARNAAKAEMKAETKSGTKEERKDAKPSAS